MSIKGFCGEILEFIFDLWYNNIKMVGAFMKKEKLTISMYECEKCNKTVYFNSNEEINTKCKTCGQEMKFWWTHPYNPKNNIRQANSMNSHSRATTQKQTQPINEYVPKCPTCGSPDVEKISLTSKVVGGALFGLFSSNVRKTMHCKNCGYKW